MILTIVIGAMALGFLGSFHCVGMCGPIALSLPVHHLKGIHKAAGIGLYNSGRIVTYAIAGLLFGFIGLSFKFFGWQQWLSIGLGIALIAAFLLQVLPGIKVKRTVTFRKWNQWVISRLAVLFKNRSKGNLFLIGMLNGMLPCGLVYMALAGAIATGNVFSSALFMAGFGAGTLPAMAVTSYAAGVMTVPVRNKIRKIMPYTLAVMGILLILRGLDLNIPFVSPHLSHGEAVNCN